MVVGYTQRDPFLSANRNIIGFVPDDIKQEFDNISEEKHKYKGGYLNCKDNLNIERRNAHEKQHIYENQIKHYESELSDSKQVINNQNKSLVKLQDNVNTKKIQVYTFGTLSIVFLLIAIIFIFIK